MPAPTLRPITDVARDFRLPPDAVMAYGATMAKVQSRALEQPARPGRLVLVSAITPTVSGEGKTTIAIALAMALRRRGRPATVVLREPSLGPVFGIKGGGTGGGRATVEPADRVNLHFTGDMHAVTAAHNLLAAMLDNDLHFGAVSGLDARRVHWPRVLDVEDRALRHVMVGLGGHSGGVPRESQFAITAASEIMAALCLAGSHDDLRARLGRIIVGQRADGTDVTADDLQAADAMSVLLRDALLPNLVQTSEGDPALVHGGPFANIAHGAPSVLSTQLALHYGHDVIVEGGFGFDLGGEKFLHIVCPQGGFWPRSVVLVVTVQALQAHGGGADEAALLRGLGHLGRQIANVRAFGLEPIVAINVFDRADGVLHDRIELYCREHGVPVARCTGYADGSAGALALADVLSAALDAIDAAPPLPRALYAADAPYHVKIGTIARTLYGARDVRLSAAAARECERLEASGHGGLPVCIAKTALSLSADPDAGGLPEPFEAHIDAVQLQAAAGFVIAHMGGTEVMPGLPREPGAVHLRLLPDGSITGLMRDR